MESPPFINEAEGDAAIETYTVIFNREGEPEQGIVIGRLKGDSSARFFANTPSDRELMLAMTREEFAGRAGRVSADEGTGRNLFEPR
jgi:acetyl-CoA C-acetyltransferase